MIHKMMKDIQQSLEKEPRQPYAVFVDFSAAFDTGSRAIALEMSRNMGCPRKSSE